MTSRFRGGRPVAGGRPSLADAPGRTPDPAARPGPLRRAREPLRGLCLLAWAALLTIPAPAGAQPAPEPPAPEAPAPEPPALTIDQAVQRALRENPDLTAAVESIRRAEAAVAEARAFQLPRVDSTARFTFQGPVPSFTFTRPPAEPGGAPQTEEITLGKSFTKNFSITGSFDPDPFGRLKARRAAAERGVNVSRGSYLTVQNELVFAVQNLYLATLRAEELVGVQREALAAAKEQLRVAEAQLRAGTAPEFDVLRARVQVENVRQALVSAEAAVRRSSASLARLLSLDPAAPLRLAPIELPPLSEEVAGAAARRLLDPAPGEAAAPVPETLEAALAEAYRRRPEVYRAEWQRRLAEARVQLERKGRLPSVALAASGFYDPDATGFAAIKKSWSIVANLSIPIWDAGLARARARQARAEARAAAAGIEAARDLVAEETRRALVDLEDAVERRRTAAANVEQAREALRIARVRYEAGLAPNVEVVDAEAALTQARANEVNAAYDYLAALASLNRSVGRYASETVASLRLGTVRE